MSFYVFSVLKWFYESTNPWKINTEGSFNGFYVCKLLKYLKQIAALCATLKYVKQIPTFSLGPVVLKFVFSFMVLLYISLRRQWNCILFVRKSSVGSGPLVMCSPIESSQSGIESATLRRKFQALPVSGHRFEVVPRYVMMTEVRNAVRDLESLYHISNSADRHSGRLVPVV